MARNKKKWDNIFPNTDLSEYLKSQRLLDAWYLLASKNVAVLVDTVKPRVFKLFAFGKFGTLQQLLYDVETFQEAGRSGLRVVYYRGRKAYTTLKDKPYIFEDTPSESITFDRVRRRVSIHGIRCYDPDLKPDKSRVDLDISQEGDGLTFSYRVAPDADRAVAEIELYPLYTDYRGRGWRSLEVVDYNCWNSRYHNPAGRFSTFVDGRLELRDRHGRVPAMQIYCPGARIHLSAFCDETRNDTHRLRLRVEGRLQERITVKLVRNPVTVHTVPIIAANRPHRIVIAANTKPRVIVAGRSFAVRAAGRGRWCSTIRAGHGKNRLLVETNEGVSDRIIAAVDDPKTWIDRMGRAAAAGLWKTGPVKGLMPQFIDVKRLVGKVRGQHSESRRSIAYCSHNPRALMIIIAAAREYRNRDLLERAWHSISAMVKIAYKHDDGAMVLPIFIYPDGSPGEVDSTRPSDLIIALRPILMIRSVFLEWGDIHRAAKALEYAKGFARALLRMAGPKGELAARYHYPTLEVTAPAQISGRGTVNNWVVNVWEFAGILEKEGDPLASKLKDICRKHADLLIKSHPSVLRLAGGGEDGPNNSDALNSTAGFLLIKYLDTGDDKWKRLAQEAFLMAALNNTIMHIDQPQNYFFTFDWTESIWHDGPMNVMSKGGMHDLTGVDVGMALAHYLEDPFARDVCAYQFLTRLVDGVYENGAVLSRVTAMPNFHYVRNDFTETLNFGAGGVFAFYHGRGCRRLTDKEKGKPADALASK